MHRFVLKDRLGPFRDQYEVIVIDTPRLWFDYRQRAGGGDACAGSDSSRPISLSRH